LLGLGNRLMSHNRALEGMLLAGAASGIVASVVVARSIGPAGRGYVVTLTVWGQILGWLATLSLDKAVVVLTAGNHQMATPDEALRAVRLPVIATSCVAVAASIVLGDRFFANAWLLTLGLAALAVATAQAELIGAWFLATGQRRAYIGWRIMQPALYIGILTGIAVVMRSANLSDRTVAMGVGASASMVLPVIFVGLRLGSRARVKGRGLSVLLRFALAAHLGTILQYLNGRLDLLALSFLVSPAALGLYSVGAALGQLSILTANAGVVRGITGESKATDFTGLALAAGFAIIVIVASPIVIPLVYGDRFMAAVSIARILAIGGVANYLLQAGTGQLLSRRRPWIVVLSQGSGAAVFVFGITIFRTLEGVAWSSVVSFLVSLLIAEAALRLADRP
jgi:O-antigen/teichoic acid export membrane protein